MTFKSGFESREIRSLTQKVAVSSNCIIIIIIIITTVTDIFKLSTNGQ